MSPGYLQVVCTCGAAGGSCGPGAAASHLLRAPGWSLRKARGTRAEASPPAPTLASEGGSATEAGVVLSACRYNWRHCVVLVRSLVPAWVLIVKYCSGFLYRISDVF